MFTPTQRPVALLCYICAVILALGHVGCTDLSYPGSNNFASATGSDSRVVWLRRPVRFGAPGVQLPVQPAAILLNGEHRPVLGPNLGRDKAGHCVLTLTGPSRHLFKLEGSTTQPLHQSVCFFSDVELALNASSAAQQAIQLHGAGGELLLQLQLCAVVPPSPGSPSSGALVACNSTSISVPLVCPALSASHSAYSDAAVFDALPAIQPQDAAEMAGDPRCLASITVIGAEFPWLQRERLACLFSSASLPGAAAGVIRTEAQFTSLCSVTCCVPGDGQNSATAGFQGTVTVSADGRRLDSGCPGRNQSATARYMEGSRCAAGSALRTAGGCPVVVHGTAAAAAAFRHDGVSPAAFSGVVSSLRDTIVGTVEVELCDSAGNPIPAATSGVAPTAVVPAFRGGSVVSSAIAPDGLSLILTNASFEPLVLSSVTGPSAATCRSVAATMALRSAGASVPPSVPLLLRPAALFGWTEPVAGTFDVNATDDQLACILLDSGRPSVLSFEPLVRARADTVTPFPFSIVAADQSGRSVRGSLSPPARVVVEAVLAGRAVQSWEVLVGAFPFADSTTVTFPSASDDWTLAARVVGEPASVPTPVAVLNQTIAVRFCAASLATVRGIVSTTANYSAAMGQQRAVCGRLQDGLVVRNAVLQDSTRPTNVSVLGGLFDYAAAGNVSCQFAAFGDPWAPDVPGIPGELLSSCEVMCHVPPQSLPIRAASAVVAVPDATGTTGGMNLVPKSSLHPVGQLRVRQATVAVPDPLWSNPVDVDVIGTGRSAVVTEWATNVYPRRAFTRIAPISVEVRDALGSPLAGVDALRRVLTVFSPARARQQLNHSGVTYAETTTCEPDPGAGVFSGLSVTDPNSGDYALYFSGTGLSDDTGVVIHVRSTDVVFGHVLGFVGDVPLPSTDRALEASANGLLPVQPKVGIFRHGSDEVDGNVSDVTCIATVYPDDPTEEAYDPVRGIGMQVPSPEFGNSIDFALGIAAFSELRFSGRPGKSYTIVFRMLNDTLTVDALNVTVYTPDCPLLVFGNDVPVVQFASPPNASLAFAATGTMIKGWKFRRPASQAEGLTYSCTLGATVLPARYVDVCTVLCFVPPNPLLPSVVPGGVTLCSTSNATGCCYDAGTGTTRCARPDRNSLNLTVPLTLSSTVLDATLEATAMSERFANVSLGAFTTIGDPVGIRVTANVASPYTLLGNQQAVLSAERAPLSGIIVDLFDSRGNDVGGTVSTLWPVQVTSASRREVPVLTVPANASAIQDKRGQAVPPGQLGSCLNASISEAQPLLIGERRGVAVDGRWSFEALSLVLPVAGTVDLTIAAYAALSGAAAERYRQDPQQFVESAEWASVANASRVAFRAVATLHVLPGQPTQVCLYTDLTGVRLRNEEVINPQPVVMLVDTAGNLYQPLRRDPSLVASGVADLLSQDDLVASFSPTAMLVRRGFDYRQNRGFGDWTVVSAALELEDGAAVRPAADFFESGEVALIQFEFRQLVPVRVDFDFEYELQFRIQQLVATTFPAPEVGRPAVVAPPDVVSPSLLARECALTEYGVRRTSDCEQCPSGLEHCVGGPSTRCFLCNGSTGMNVTSGYWRYSEFSVVAYHCSTGGVCLGDTELGTCADTYLDHEPLCAVCEEGYARDILGTCVDCAATWVSVVVLLLFVLAGAVVLLIFVIVTLKEDGNEGADHSLVLLLKIFVNFVQVAGMLGEFEVNFPSYVTAYFNIVSASSGGAGISISPVNCLFPHLNFLNKLVIQLVAPPLLLVVIAVALLIHGYRRRRKEERRAVAAGVRLVDVASDTDVESEGYAEERHARNKPEPEATDPRLTAHKPGDKSRRAAGQQAKDDEAAAATASGSAIDIEKREELRRNRVARRLERMRRREVARLHAEAGNGGGGVTGDPDDLRLRRRKARLFNWNLFTTTAVILLFIIYQTIVSQAIDTFRCEDLDTGIEGSAPLRVLRADARVDCRTPDYMRHVAVAMYGLFAYGAVLPLGGMIVVLRTALQIDWFAANGTFSFLIRGFRLRWWFWEFVIVFRKVLIRVLLSAIEDATLQALLGIWALTGLFLLHAYTRPYVKTLHNNAEGLGLLTLVVTLNFGLLFRSTQLTSGDVCGPTCGALVVLLILMNVAVIAFFVVTIVRALIDRVVEMFGVDRTDGSRWVSVRNIRRQLLLLSGQTDHLAPSFGEYIPPFQDRGLALSVLGVEPVAEVEDAIAAAEEFAEMKRKAKKTDDGFLIVDRDGKVEGGDDPAARKNSKLAMKKRKSKGKDGRRGGAKDGAGSGGSDDESSTSSSDTDVDELVEALFDAPVVPAMEGPVDLPPAAGTDPQGPLSVINRGGQAMRRVAGTVQDTVTDMPNAARDAAEKAKERAVEAAAKGASAARDVTVKGATAARDATVKSATAARDATTRAAKKTMEVTDEARLRAQTFFRSSFAAPGSFASQRSLEANDSGNTPADSETAAAAAAAAAAAGLVARLDAVESEVAGEPAEVVLQVTAPDSDGDEDAAVAEAFGAAAETAAATSDPATLDEMVDMVEDALDARAHLDPTRGGGDHEDQGSDGEGSNRQYDDGAADDDDDDSDVAEQNEAVASFLTRLS